VEDTVVAVAFPLPLDTATPLKLTDEALAPFEPPPLKLPPPPKLLPPPKVLPPEEKEVDCEVTKGEGT
jgi:hypothetical protein